MADWQGNWKFRHGCTGVGGFCLLGETTPDLVSHLGADVTVAVDLGPEETRAGFRFDFCPRYKHLFHAKSLKSDPP